jgi:hypothetical protein
MLHESAMGAGLVVANNTCWLVIIDFRPITTPAADVHFRGAIVVPPGRTIIVGSEDVMVVRGVLAKGSVRFSRAEERCVALEYLRSVVDSGRHDLIEVESIDEI